MTEMTIREKMKEMEAVIFDLDGTLVDSMWIWDPIDVEFLGEYGHQVPPDLHEAIEGMSFTETAAYFKERFSIPLTLEEMKNRWNEMAMNKYLRQVPLKEGAAEFLKQLRDRGVQAGIATSNSRQLVESVLQARGIGEYFSSVVTGCEVKAGKPAPDIYLRAAENLGVSPKACMVFEDVPAGIRAGKRAGMTVTAVADACSAGVMEEKKRLADYYIEDYRALL